MITLCTPKTVIKKILFFTKYKKERRKNVNFGEKKILKSDFYKNKKVTKIDVDKILVSKEDPYGTKNSFKYFIGYNGNDHHA